MATTREDIKRWLKMGKKAGSTHLLVCVDTFDYSDYPVFVSPEENAREIYSQYNGPNMQKVMEVYNLSMDFEMQLNQKRSFNFDNLMEFTDEPFLKK